MTFLNKFSVLILMMGLLFTACDPEENVDEVVPTGNPDFETEVVVVNSLINALTVTTTEGMEFGCLSINYPFDLLTASGEIATITSDEELEAALMEEGDFEAVDFIYPLSITDEEGNMSMVANTEELGIAFASCIPDEEWDDAEEYGGILPAFLPESLCFDLVYPLSASNQGTDYTINSDEELIDLMATFPNDVFFNLPLNVVAEDGSELTIESASVFFNLVYTCNGASPPVVADGFVIQGFACNNLLYPFDVRIASGEVITISSQSEYAELVFSGEEVELQYPFSLENIIDGEVSVINNSDELIDAINSCGGIIIEIDPIDSACDSDTPAHILLFFNQNGPVSSPCRFYINYPVQVTLGGTTYDINTTAEYFEVYNQTNNWNDIKLLYPASVTMYDDSSIVTFEEENDVCTFIDECF